MAWNTNQILLARPVEITAANNTVTVTKTSTGTTYPYSVTVGIYPHVGSVIYALDALMAGKGNVTYSGTTGKATVAMVADYSLAWTDTALRDLLGFVGGIADGATTAATYTPTSVWLPSRSRSDNNDWGQDQKIEWKGVESRQGTVVGLRTGCAIYRLTMEFEALADVEVLRSTSTTTAENVRSLEYFVSQTRVSWGTIGTPSQAGFYLFQDAADASTLAASATYTDGDPNISIADWVFCHFDADFYLAPKPTIGSIRAPYYNVALDIHTATAPTWSGA
jgi:hypothetical protein